MTSSSREGLAREAHPRRPGGPQAGGPRGLGPHLLELARDDELLAVAREHEAYIAGETLATSVGYEADGAGEKATIEGGSANRCLEGLSGRNPQAALAKGEPPSDPRSCEGGLVAESCPTAPLPSPRRPGGAGGEWSGRVRNPIDDAFGDRSVDAWNHKRRRDVLTELAEQRRTREAGSRVRPTSVDDESPTIALRSSLVADGLVVLGHRAGRLRRQVPRSPRSFLRG